MDHTRASTNLRGNAENRQAITKKIGVAENVHRNRKEPWKISEPMKLPLSAQW